MLIFGHRGVPSLEPENTLRSFKKAEELRADYIELDARLSVDGEVVLIHDHNLIRSFGINTKVADLTVSELKKLTASREIPTLSEVLHQIAVPLNIHVKVHGLEHKLVELLKNFSSDVLISSTYPGVLKKIRALDEKIKLGLIIGRGEWHLWFILNWLTKNLNLYSIHPSKNLINVASVAYLKLLKRKIFVWTVNSREEFEKMKQLEVDGVITDYVHLLKQYDQSRSI